MSSHTVISKKPTLHESVTGALPGSTPPVRCGVRVESEWRMWRRRLRDELDANEWLVTRSPETVSDIVETTQRALRAVNCTVSPADRRRHTAVFGWLDGYHGVDHVAHPRAAIPDDSEARRRERRNPLLSQEQRDSCDPCSAIDRRSDGFLDDVAFVARAAGNRLLLVPEAARENGEVDLAQSDDWTTPRTCAASVDDDVRSTVRALMSAIKAKDPCTYVHSLHVAEYSVLCGSMLDLDAESMRTLETAALLHDIGKLGIDVAILQKPEELTEFEYSMVQDHPVIGAAIVRDGAAMGGVVELILHHHESYDGSGYPCGLVGESIPLRARIVAVSDAFDSMTTGRPYRDAMSVSESMQELMRCRGRQFCPVALDAFVAGLERYSGDLPQGAGAMARVDALASHAR